MNDLPAVSDPKLNLSSSGLLIWVVLQIAALAIAAARVPLFAEFPQPGEFHSIVILSCAQWLTVSLLFPMLWCNWRGALWIVLSGAAMLLFAGALSVVDIRALAPAVAAFTLFMLTIYVWGTLARSIAQRMLISAIATTINLGGPLLVYLREDLGKPSAGGTEWSNGAFWNFIKNIQNPGKECWISLGSALTLGILLRFVRWPRDSQSAPRTS